MRFEIALKFIIFSFALIAISGVLFSSPQNSQAAVPVVTMPDSIISEIEHNTQYEVSLETFILNTFNAFASQQRDFVEDLANKISTREENWLASFELAKIEKAREDINKLTYEVYRELNPEALQLEKRLTADEIGEIIKSQGFFTNAFDPSTGQRLTIKQEGRIITNIDDFLEEEPIQKARDYVYCALAPWKHFPLDTEDEQFCVEYNLTSIASGKDRCTTQNVCDKMAKDGKQCKSDERRDEFKDRLLNEIHRKHKFLVTAPPESWYTPDRCQLILEGLSCDRIPEESGSSCPVGAATCPISETPSGPCLRMESAIGDKRTNPTGNYDELNDAPTIDLAPSPNRVLSWNDYIQLVSNPNNSPLSLFEKVRGNANRIIQEYRVNRQVQYIAGQGLRPEKYLIGFPDKPPGSENEDLYKYGRELEGYTGKYYFIDTENIISPAVILQNKLAAATQAQFDLAQMAFKIYPQGQQGAEGLQRTGNPITDMQTGNAAKILGGAGELTPGNIGTIAEAIANNMAGDNKAIMGATTGAALEQLLSGRAVTPDMRDKVHKELEKTLYNNVDAATATKLRNEYVEPILKAYTGQVMTPALLNKMTGEINAQTGKQLDAYYNPAASQIQGALGNFLGPLNNSRIGQIANELTGGVLSNFNSRVAEGIQSIFRNTTSNTLAANQGSQIDNALIGAVTGGINQLTNNFLGNLPAPLASVMQPIASNLLSSATASLGGFINSNSRNILGGEVMGIANNLLGGTITDALGLGGIIGGSSCSGIPISNGAGKQIGCISQRSAMVNPMHNPPLSELPAPWEDTGAYAQLSPDYKKEDAPPAFGNNYYLNIWYKDIFQMDRKHFNVLLQEWFKPESSLRGTGAALPGGFLGALTNQFMDGLLRTSSLATVLDNVLAASGSSTLTASAINSCKTAANEYLNETVGSLIPNTVIAEGVNAVIDGLAAGKEIPDAKKLAADVTKAVIGKQAQNFSLAEKIIDRYGEVLGANQENVVKLTDPVIQDLKNKTAAATKETMGKVFSDKHIQDSVNEAARQINQGKKEIQKTEQAIRAEGQKFYDQLIKELSDL